MTTLNPKPHVFCLDWAANLWLAGFKDVQGLEKEYIWGVRQGVYTDLCKDMI